MGFSLPRRYTDEELNKISSALTERFITERASQENGTALAYHERFSSARAEARHVLAMSSNLLSLSTDGQALLCGGYLPVMRSMTRPTVSEDDFKTMIDLSSSSLKKFEDRAVADLAIGYIERNLNADIFPWVEKGAAPSEGEIAAAVTAVAALVADQKTKTSLRGRSSKKQEKLVRDTLVKECSLHVVSAHEFTLLSDAPHRGEIFNREVKAGSAKADIVLGLHDGRILCLECKSSNSAVNSFKRLNHEVVDKVKKWSADFGAQCVAGAVLEGRYSPQNLASAQAEGAYLFWSSDLTDLVDFVNSTLP